MKKSKKTAVEKKTQEEPKKVEETKEEKPIVIAHEEPQNNVGKMTKNPKKLACVEKWKQSKL
jgi:hypothetical protein|tara:strand:- start:56 stop:241 length:186 start_codon:yes stop_codon:yes gene_type:complete